VLIVGAGYAGLSAGLTLARAGRSVAIFDRQDPGEGASTRNGGITSGNLKPNYATLVRRFGAERAIAIEAEGKSARNFLYALLKDEGIDCDFQHTGRFTGAIGADDYDGLARAADKLRKTLGIEAHAVPQAEQRGVIGTDFYRGGLVRMDIGGLHPAKFHAGLMRATIAAGASVHAQTAVQGIERDGTGFSVATAGGKVQARRVLVCTNGYTDGVDPWLRRRMVPVRSRIIATEELAPELMAKLMPARMMYGETRELGFYYRPSPDGRRILFGGRDGTIAGDPVGSTAHLRRNLVELFPELENVRLSHSWFGFVAMHRDMIPRIFTSKGITYAAGFCGSGVVWAPWLGHCAARKLLGEEASQPSAFDFRPPAAVPFYRGRPWFLPIAMQIFRMQDKRAMQKAGRL
jgi:glycine/D-amino acid oxidase-like deaminating enzyme